MQYTNLGRTGLSVSRLCLGTMNFGPQTSEPDAHGIMDAALDAGINYLDTANVYGRRKGEGVTEQIIGRWFVKGGKRRERVVLATKLWGSMGDWPNQSRLSARHIREACDESLRRLQTDYIDIYQMHHIDRDTPFDEIWQAMELLVQQGKILYVGSSNFAGWSIAHAQETAHGRHFLGLVSEQCLYNLAVRNAEEEVLPAAIRYGLGVICWSPLFRGLLSGVIAPRESADRTTSNNAREQLKKLRPQIEKYEALCAELGHPPAEVALAWLLSRPGVTAPIIGPRTLDQLRGNLQAIDVQLDGATLKKLDRIFPGPGEAPDSWAW
jgi:NDP-hexose 2,3-enoyl reductase